MDPARARRDARTILDRALAETDLAQALPRILAGGGGRLEVRGAAVTLRPRLLVASVGKASRALLAAFLAVPGVAGRVERGVLVTGAEGGPPPPGFEAVRSGHPVPDEGSLRAADAVCALARGAGPDATFVLLVSGGGSSMLERPLDPSIGVRDLQRLNALLVTCGAPIGEINTVRKHLSAVKGGRLAALAAPAHVLTLCLSDVPGDDPALVASGPTVADPTTVADCHAILDRHGLIDRLPDAVRAVLARGLPETPASLPGPGEVHVLLGSGDVTRAARAAAESLGYRTVVATDADELSVGAAADRLLGRLVGLRAEEDAGGGRPVCVVADGEVLSPVLGSGVGGRNQAFVLACVRRLAGTGRCVLSAGTDGIDGNSPAAGALADGETLDRARAAGLDPAAFAAASDSHGFFSRLGLTIETGPTGNNLRDLRVLLDR